MLVMLSVVFPVLVSVVAWGELEWPICTVPKLRLAGTSLTETDCGAVTVTIAEADLVGSAAEVAVIATLGLLGTVAGPV